MAVIAHVTIGVGVNAVTPTTLAGSDTFVYTRGANQFLVINNPTGGGIACTIDGADGTTVGVPGLGPVSVAAGYALGTIAAGATKVVQLDSIDAYLQGVIAITGTGLTAFIIN